MIKRLLFAIGLMGLCLLATPPLAGAVDLYKGVDCSKAQQAAVCTDKAQKDSGTGKYEDPLTGKDGTLAKATNILAYVGGAAAVIVIIVAGLKYVTSGSDVSTNSRTDADIETAKRAIANAVIGLVVIALARTLILFVLGKT